MQVVHSQPVAVAGRPDQPFLVGRAQLAVHRADFTIWRDIHEAGVQALAAAVGRALDNRIGGFIIAKVLERLAGGKQRPEFEVLAVNAVQEEIGGYGARMVTHRLRPDVAVCLDVTHATDTPGIKKELHGDVKLGGGPSVGAGPRGSRA